MADETNNTARDQLNEASLQGCYLDTLLTVLEDIVEEIEGFAGKLPEIGPMSWVRDKARVGLNVVYMAQDKAGAIKNMTDEVERELWRAENRREAVPN